MHSAPSVSYPVGPSSRAAHGLLALWALGAACAGAAVVHMQTLGGRAGLLAASVLLAGGAAWRFAHHGVSGDLHFDGQHWSLSGVVSLGAARVAVGLDLQFAMLLRLAQADRAHEWLWVERQVQPARWQDLRRAVYSRPATASSAAAPSGMSSVDASPNHR